MVMDRNYKGLYDATSLKDDGLSYFPDVNLINNLRVSDDVPQFQPDPKPEVLVPSVTDNSHEDYDFSDVVLKYISQMLMEENIEEKACTFHESAALQAAERSFYEVIGQKYPPSPNQKMPDLGQDSSNCYSCVSDVTDGLLCPNWNPDLGDSDFSHTQQFPVDSAYAASSSQSSHSSPSSSGTVTDAHVDSPVGSSIQIPDIFSDSESIMQFKRGVEEASKFLPTGNSLLLDVRYNVVVKEDNNENRKDVKVEHRGKQRSLEGSIRGKKNTHHDDDDVMEERRSNKQSAVFYESTVRSDLFDKVLLCSGGKNESALRESWQTLSSKNAPEKNILSTGRKSRGKKQGGKRDAVDLRTILTLCAQAVAADDRRTANEFLKQIRQNSSPTGDGMQRLAHYFANGLEARMAGSGTQIYTDLISLPTSAADILKAYQLFLAACPFRKLSNFFSNKTIMNLAETASTVHIIDFGIMYGFQWPCFIQRLSCRPGGPPKLRITGIDFPNPGFRPAERIEETGRRLANYAESFNVPFEFIAIAQKWETIKVEDLKIQKEDEVLVVNCLYRFRNLLDETVVVNSPRDIVLNLIRKVNPNVFIQGIVNGAYNAPFFITRFREALFHYSSVFDMLEANIPREIPERLLVEKIIFGREAMNVVACEAAERIERPETYKQWLVRNIRAGFRQLPLNEEILRMAKDRVKAYHKDFVIDVDGHWLLQGWKGRIIFALSTWKAAD
ncbi:scarecrow-like protein 14 [Lycium barbarum]|uniref:scarecrow-like protein 14 n=1 Tax=Lycium barbarum TaxID=112863 RepID=UPI00293F0227|nr:scarecrow-like protein 14 [Lycium barbarum]